MRQLGVTASVVLTFGLTACAGTEYGGNAGDCTARVRLEGIVYDTDGHATQNPPLADSAARQAEVVGCYSDPVDRVEVRAVEGVDESLVVVVERGGWRGVYVNETTGPSDWPPVLTGQS